jgi:hypothetical protein
MRSIGIRIRGVMCHWIVLVMMINGLVNGAWYPVDLTIPLHILAFEKM